MIWRLRSRSRTICLSLALACASLYLLLLLLASRPLRLRPCRSPPPPQTRFLAGGNVSSVGVKEPADASGGDASGTASSPGGRPPRGGSRHGTEPPEPAEAGLAKLEALFNHPLYSWPHPPIPEEDLLLRVRAKVTSSGRSSQMWGSDSLEDGDRDGDGDGDVPRSGSSSSRPPWLRFHLGISRRQLYSHPDPNTAPLLQQLATHRIVSAVQKSGGTQLKLVMSFPNSGQAVFKPMKQERDEETNYNLYYFSDFERHNAEIAAFHLDRILGYRRVPPVVGRLIDVIKEIKNVTTDRKLARTFFTSPVGSVCFYGQCSYYCSTEHAVCGRPTGLEASLAVMLPDVTLATRRSWKSPWRRSYSRSKLAKWETQADYCATVKQTAPYDEGTRLVDFMDMVVLDFLMSNMDRHHYETFEKFGSDTFLLHLDNGRGFGRHSKDEPSILAPLEQCCRIRRSTWLRLRLLSLPPYRLSDVMRASLSRDPLHAVAPLLSEAHLAALDRRLKTVLETVDRCQRRRSEDGGQVFYDDLDLKDVSTPAGEGRSASNSDSVLPVES